MTTTTDAAPGTIVAEPRQQPLLVVRDLRKHFAVKGGFLSRTQAVVQAVDDVTFDVMKGETLGIVGESGCGKSTTARVIMHLIEPDSGEVVFDGQAVGRSDGIGYRELYRNVQMVFQDSYSSLNPRLPMALSVAFGPMVHGMPRNTALEKAATLLGQVGLDPANFANRYSHELSGGQRQRVNIARALALEPKLLLLDEAVSSLDKSIEAQVLNLLFDLKREFDLTYIFISHDLNVVRYISDRVLVMYLGKVAEIGTVDAVYSNPRHPYTQALLSSMPSMDPRRRTEQAPLTGDPPNPINPPSGCRFRTRCPFAEDICAGASPRLSSHPEHGISQQVACHIHDSSSGHSRATATEAPGP
jgi:peptide/nickel transport system ATP-binding protein